MFTDGYIVNGRHSNREGRTGQAVAEWRMT